MYITVGNEQELAGFLKKITKSFNKVVGKVLKVVGKVMPKELAKIIPKELGKVLNVLGPVAILFPPALALSIALKVAEVAQMAAEARRDTTKANKLKREIAQMQANAQAEGMAIEELSIEDILSHVSDKREELRIEKEGILKQLGRNLAHIASYLGSPFNLRERILKKRSAAQAAQATKKTTELNNRLKEIEEFELNLTELENIMQEALSLTSGATSNTVIPDGATSIRATSAKFLTPKNVAIGAAAIVAVTGVGFLVLRKKKNFPMVSGVSTWDVNFDYNSRRFVITKDGVFYGFANLFKPNFEALRHAESLVATGKLSLEETVQLTDTVFVSYFWDEKTESGTFEFYKKV